MVAKDESTSSILQDVDLVLSGALAMASIERPRNSEAIDAEDVDENAPWFVWSDAIYRARLAAEEFGSETHADYTFD